MMYVKIKKIYTHDKCECTQHAQTYYFNIRMCIFIYTRVFKKTKSTRQKRQEILQRRQKIYLNMMFVYYFHHLHHFQLSTRDL